MIEIVVMATFFGIVWWAYSPARRSRLERDAQSIFEEDAP